MSHAFAKDSRACAACVSWGGEREVAADLTLVHVARYSVEGECRTASSQDYRRVTKAYHTCLTWAPLPMLKAHGARPARSPGPSAAMTGLLAATAGMRAAEGGAAPPVEEPAADEDACRSAPLDIDKAPPQARVLYAHWRRARGERPLPAASDLDTAQMRDAVARLCLFLPDAAGGYRYRACGRAVQRRLEVRTLARTVAECHPSAAAARLVADLDACRRTGEPLCLLVANDPILPGQRFVELLLPLAGEGGGAGSVLAYRHLPGG